MVDKWSELIWNHTVKSTVAQGQQLLLLCSRKDAQVQEKKKMTVRKDEYKSIPHVM